MSGVADWKTDKFDDVYLTIEHSYWGKWVGVTKGDSNNGYVKGVIKFTNNAKIALKNVKVFLDLDDTAITWDANTRNSDGTVSDLGIIDLGTVPAGGEVSYNFWWGLKHLFGPTAQDFDVTFNIIPYFEVEYSKYDAFKSVSKVSAT